MTTTLAERVAGAIVRPTPPVVLRRRLWLVGTGPFHDAAELGTFPFKGSGQSAAVVAGEGHARLGELLGPQDTCILVGGDGELRAYVERVSTGVGATVIPLDPDITADDDPTAAFTVAGAGVLALCHGLEAPGVTDEDLLALPSLVAEAATAPAGGPPDRLGHRVIVMGTGPAAVTARHLAVALRRSDSKVVVEGLDAQDVVGAAADHLGPGTTVIALDPGRDPDAPVARVAKMARGEGASVIEVPGEPTLGPVAAQLPLAVIALAVLGR
jgi:hypothetical protein